MPTSLGHFVWYELMTTDIAAASEFYRGVVGWSAADSGMPGMSYTILSVAEAPVGGILQIPADAAAGGAKPGWMGYIAVDDVDAMALRASQQGGAVHKAASDIPGVGRFAVLADPQGAPFIVFKPNTAAAPAMAPPTAPGTPGWHELQASDWQGAFSFYSGLFGWTKSDAVDMGAMGLYQMFCTGGPPVGGMMTKMDAASPTSWRYYFNTDDIDAAARRITDHGGQVLAGPHQVPGGSWIVHGQDPQGATFALVDIQP